MRSQELLRLEGIEKRFGQVEVLRGLDLSVKAGEFITLLGSSGCGKTTTLRIIAGLERADAGRVFLAGEDVTGLEPHRRDVNMVFQNYALFPHMNVEMNISYSLRLKRRPKAEIKKAAADALELVRLAGYGKRMPQELSGGQRQRVAVARAVVNRPKVLLLDEPLGALDLQLRRQMQAELKGLQKQLGITFIYITHDQEEALNMSDRIAVMREGRFEQIGSAADVYDRPRTSFVARFVGNANILTGVVGPSVHESPGETLAFEHPSGRACLVPPPGGLLPGQAVTLAVRSEYVELSPAPSGDEPSPGGGFPGLAAVITGKTFAGGQLRITAALLSPESLSGYESPLGALPALPAMKTPPDMKAPPGMKAPSAMKAPPGLSGVVVASRHGIDSPLMIGQEVRIGWKASRAVVVDADNGWEP